MWHPTAFGNSVVDHWIGKALSHLIRYAWTWHDITYSGPVLSLAPRTGKEEEEEIKETKEDEEKKETEDAEREAEDKQRGEEEEEEEQQQQQQKQQEEGQKLQKE